MLQAAQGIHRLSLEENSSSCLCPGLLFTGPGRHTWQKPAHFKLVLPATIADVSLPHISSDQQLPAKPSLRNPFQLLMTAVVAHRRREILQKDGIR